MLKLTCLSEGSVAECRTNVHVVALRRLVLALLDLMGCLDRPCTRDQSCSALICATTQVYYTAGNFGNDDIGAQPTPVRFHIQVVKLKGVQDLRHGLQVLQTSVL